MKKKTTRSAAPSPKGAKGFSRPNRIVAFAAERLKKNAGEFALAAEHGRRDHVISQAAELLNTVLILIEQRGVEIAEIEEAMLRQRSGPEMEKASLVPA